MERWKQLWGLLVLATLILNMLATPRPAQANVTLIDFTASASASGVNLAWSTGTEFESAGFIVKRATDLNAFQPLYNDGDVVAVTYQGESTTFIPAAGTSGAGASYAAADDGVETGVVYWYRLIEIEINQNRIELETESVTAGVLPTATPVGPGFSVPPTATPQPAATTSPTDTPQPTPTAIPTATPRATQPSPSPIPPTPIPPTPIPPTVPAVSSPLPSSATPLPTATNPVTGNPPTASVAQAAGVRGVEAAPAEQAYPAETPTVDAAYEGAAPTPADSVPLDSSNTPPAAIGDEGVVVTLPPPRDAADETTGGSRLILWGGFLAALAIFVAGVVGSILIFNRRQA